MCYLPLPTRITHDHVAMRRDGDIAPYRHYARVVRRAPLCDLMVRSRCRAHRTCPVVRSRGEVPLR